MDVTPGAGRFSVGGGSNYWEVRVGPTNDFSITFTEDIAAFGFYGTDIGDLNGQLSLNFISGGMPTNVMVPHTVDGPSGSALFFGYIHTGNPFQSVEFELSGSSSDVFGFDLLTIGTVEQVRPDPDPVPEPMSVLLLGSGILGVGAVAIRRRREEEE